MNEKTRLEKGFFSYRSLNETELLTNKINEFTTDGLAVIESRWRELTGRLVGGGVNGLLRREACSQRVRASGRLAGCPLPGGPAGARQRIAAGGEPVCRWREPVREADGRVRAASWAGQACLRMRRADREAGGLLLADRRREACCGGCELTGRLKGGMAASGMDSVRVNGLRRLRRAAATKK